MKQTCHKLLGGGNKHNANILEVVARGGGGAHTCTCVCMHVYASSGYPGLVHWC